MMVKIPLKKIVSAFMVLLILILSCAIDVTPVSAVSIVVDTTNDEIIDDTSCSLREALLMAIVYHTNYYGCEGGSSTFITVPSGTYTVDIGSLPSIDNATITIHGEGPSATIIQAANCNPTTETCSYTDRLFYIGSAGDLTLEDLTIQNGYVNGDYGGVIENNEGTLSIYNSIFTANVSNRGGAIYNQGTLYITESTFSSNMVGTDAVGGAIYNRHSPSAFIEKSTFSNNSANYGGAIWNTGSDPGDILEIENCTFSNNTAGNYGGALVVTGTTVLTNNTFSENSAITGAGIYIASGADLSLTNTIIANSSSGGDCANYGTINTNLSNLIEDGSCSSDYSGDPSLSSLGNFGGPTQTHALLQGSSAVDSANNGACPETDQRWVERPQPVLGDCDIGAYEQQYIPSYIPLFMR